MSLMDLQALLWLARAGSLHAAAQASGISRTTLRRRLDRLQTAVGKPLAELSSQGVKLTPAGELLVKRAPRLLVQQAALLEEARGASDQPAESLRVLIATGFPPVFTAHVLSRVIALVPALCVELHQDPRPLDRLDEGFDLVVHWGSPPLPRDGYSRVLLRQAQRLMAAPAYLERRGVPRSVEELDGHTLLHLAGEPRVWPLLEGGELPIRPAHTADDLYLLGCLVGEELGIALVPRSGVGVGATVDALVPVLDDVVGDELVVRVFMPMRTSASGARRALLDMIRKLWDS